MSRGAGREPFRWSAYTLREELPGGPGRVFAVNTLTGACAVVPGGLSRLAEKRGPTTPVHLADLVGELVRAGIFVRCRDDDRLRFRWWLRRALCPGGNYAPTVCPTLGCNLACTYCYQWRVGRSRAGTRHKVMTQRVLRQTLDWIKDYLCASRQWSGVGLGIFGGEPLLAPQVVLDAVRSLARFCSGRGMQLNTLVVTNGTRLTGSLAGALREAAGEYPVGVQVTVDGPGHVHDKRRRYVSNRGSYAQIVRNLRTACQHLHVAVRVNLDRENYLHVAPLFEELALLAHETPIHVYVAPTQKCGAHCDDAALGGTEMVDSLWEAWEAGAAAGLEVAAPVMAPGPCVEHTGAGVTVGPDGTVYSCPGFAGQPGMGVGHVARPVVGPAHLAHLAAQPWEACPVDCPVLPWCLGGCRHAAYLETGDWRAITCKRQTIEALGRAYYKFKFRKELQGRFIAWPAEGTALAHLARPAAARR